MNFFLPMLAQESGSGSGAGSVGLFGMNEEARTQMIYVGIFSVLILSIVVWAAFIRKTKNKRKRITRPHTWQAEPGAEKTKHKRSRREHRRRSSGQSSNQPANPTLATTRGLPPRRPDDVPPTGA